MAMAVMVGCRLQPINRKKTDKRKKNLKTTFLLKPPPNKYSLIPHRKTPFNGNRYQISFGSNPKYVFLDIHQVLAKVVSPRGKLILSGMLKEDYREVLTRHQKLFLPIKMREKNGWVTLLMKKI